MYRQTPKVKRPWNPRDWFDNDPPLYYDESLTEVTAQSLKKFLRNKKGFYHAEVNPIVTNRDQRVSVRYVIEAGKRYIIESIEYSADDPTMLSTLESLHTRSFLKVGDPVDATNYDLERSRLTTALQNQGYANFISNYISLNGDSSDYKVKLTLEVLPPLPDTIHKQYSIGNINVFTDHVIDSPPEYKKMDTLGGNYYFANNEDFVVSPKAIDNCLYLESGASYSKDQDLKTYRSLQNLSSYRYIEVKRNVDTRQDSIINVDFFLSPHRNKWIIDLGSDLFYSTVNQTGGRRLIGVSANASLQNRNLLGGSERYNLDVENTLEFNLGNLDSLINTFSFNIENNLDIPRHIKLFGFKDVAKKAGFLKGPRYSKFLKESDTEISLGYNFTKIINFYSLSSLNASWGYDYRPSNRSRYILNQIGLNLINPTVDSTFRANNLDNNPLLAQSFVRNLSTGFLFRNLTYFYQGPKNLRGRSFGFLSNIEVSGLETFLSNKLYNAISGSEKTWTLGSFNFSKYIKGEVDGRIFKDVSKGSSINARVNLGLAIPFGGGNIDNAVPYPVQFYVGGPNSIRAWQIRELGPGGYSELLLNPVEGQQFFQAGDMKFEFNLEYRWDFFWYVEGALFLDGGNIWSLRDNTLPGAQFGSDFLDQMALGIGYGLRFDFTYFLIRFDFGYKLRNPFPDENGSHFALKRKFHCGSPRCIPIGNINIAVNYPF